MFLGIFIPRGNYLLIFEENYHRALGGKINSDRHFVNLPSVIDINPESLFIDQKIIVMTK